MDGKAAKGKRWIDATMVEVQPAHAYRIDAAGALDQYGGESTMYGTGTIVQ
jgi:hypothetical protein